MSESVDVLVKKDVKKPTLPTSASNFPLPKLLSPYRSDNQPFTTYIPYQPLHREQHIQQPQLQQRHQHQPEQHEAQPLSVTEAQERKHDQADTQPLPAQPHRALPLPQQQQLLQQQLHQARPPASSVIIFKQDKPKRAISKKAGKPFVCKHPGCTWAFARHSDLTRHTKSHAPPQYVCPYWRNDPTCHKKDGSFNRLDVLKRHLRLIHYVKDKQPMGQLSPGDDPGWCRSCQRMFPNSKAFVEHCLDCAKNTTPTEWIEIKKEGGSTNPNQATFRVNLEQVKKTKST
ncbi:Transcriptional factor SWI5 [Candida viswanathii]|uniref:Transcriptional factor SWI5 n=1 Tax=Candida viswanathii TaxID=5486 RepID=A0A367XZQ3_9ASCO|nr:Transcriptional factor SWI5 [Candida viswanathii]